MTVQFAQEPARPILGVLKSRDPNRTPLKSSAQKNSTTPLKASVQKLSKPQIREIPASPVPALPSLTREEQKQRFDQVVKCRVGEDSFGDMEDDGIFEWSLDDFEYAQKLGAGACAQVFLAHERQSGYPVALKVQKHDDAETEMDVHFDLNHPNVVKMVDYFFADASFHPNDICLSDVPLDPSVDEEPQKYLYMILEFCNGGSLFDVLDESPEGRLDEPTASRYLLDAMAGVEHVHEQGIIHCDIKPGNFLVDGETGSVKLADFGMAVRDDELEVIGGSPVYMAPEHLMAWRTKSEDFDHKVDIYGLGVVLYQLLVGELPFVVLDHTDSCDSFAAMIDNLRIQDDKDLNPPILDLRMLEDQDSSDPFLQASPEFPNFISEEAIDLISKLMEVCPEKRVSLADAKQHPWFQKQRPVM